MTITSMDNTWPWPANFRPWSWSFASGWAQLGSGPELRNKRGEGKRDLDRQTEKERAHPAKASARDSVEAPASSSIAVPDEAEYA